jgi:hypothetical protein
MPKFDKHTLVAALYCVAKAFYDLLTAVWLLITIVPVYVSGVVSALTPYPWRTHKDVRGQVRVHISHKHARRLCLLLVPAPGWVA